jgi:hypothetical protein
LNSNSVGKKNLRYVKEYIRLENVQLFATFIGVVTLGHKHDFAV